MTTLRSHMLLLKSFEAATFVSSRKQWLTLRTEYLKLQKANMNQLKKKLKDIRSDDQSHEKTKPGATIRDVIPRN